METGKATGHIRVQCVESERLDCGIGDTVELSYNSTDPISATVNEVCGGNVCGVI